VQKLRTKPIARTYRVVEDKVVGPVESWGVTACFIDRTIDRAMCHHLVRCANSLLCRLTTLHPTEKAVVMSVVGSGATLSSTTMTDLRRTGTAKVFPLSPHLPLQLLVVDSNWETTSGTRVGAPGLRRIRSARSLIRSSS